MQVRKTIPRIMIGGNDYYLALADYVIGFSFTDNLGKADDLQLTLSDIKRRFITDSFPLKAQAELEVWITVNDWRFPTDRFERDCGLFEIDTVSYKFAPSEVSVNANSVAGSKTLKNTKRIRPFENISFPGLCEQIATEQGMTVKWDTQEFPRFKRVEQNDQSDLEFLQKLCDDSNLILKVKRNQLIIFSENEYEQKEPKITFEYGVNVWNGSFETKEADTAKEAEVQFMNPETGKLTTGRAVDSKSLSRNKIRSSKRPAAEPDSRYDLLPTALFAPRDDVPELIDYKNDEPAVNAGKGTGLKTAATRKAKSELRKANRDRDTAKLTVMGMPQISAGEPVNLKGFGKFDGKYILESVQHNVIATPYQCSVSLHKELGGEY